MDIWSPDKRSAVMARIRGRDTKPELIVRSLLHRSGLRFSLRRKDLPGKPENAHPWVDGGERDIGLDCQKI